MHAIALFLATISLFYNTAVSSPAPTPVPFLDPNAIQRREDPVTGACYATSKSGDVDVPTPLPSPECQVDMKTVITCGPSRVVRGLSVLPTWGSGVRPGSTCGLCQRDHVPLCDRTSRLLQPRGTNRLEPMCSFLFRVDVNPAAIPAIYLVDLFEASQAEFMIGQCSSQILYIYDESSRVNNGMFKTREASCNEYAPQKSDPSRALGQMT